jgi:hypothetical protein
LLARTRRLSDTIVQNTVVPTAFWNCNHEGSSRRQVDHTMAHMQAPQSTRRRSFIVAR